MAINFDVYTRLEPQPGERDLEAGFSAELYDPVWFIGRQWQMGEHQGENASSPIWANYLVNTRPILASDKRFDPRVIPAEAIVESELFDWWTMGRRIRIGQKLAGHTAVEGKPELLFSNPSPPYEHFNEQPDGLLIWQKRVTLGIDDNEFGIDIPYDSPPSWDSRALLYQQTRDNSFEADKLKLMVNSHHGGHLDWYSVEASKGNAVINEIPVARAGIPTALQYSGAPNSRWWEFENSEVDIGGYVPDSSHTATAFLTELIFSHSDDWFLLPVLAEAGHIITLRELKILDVFGRKYNSTDVNDVGKPVWPGLQPPSKWTLFQVNGLKSNDLVLWHVAEMPLESTPLERVQFGLDEESNVLWAVERTIDGRDVDSRNKILADPLDKLNSGSPKGNNNEREYAYVPGQGIVPYWHPYVIDEINGIRWLVQRGLPDLSLKKPVLMPSPKAEVLQPLKHKIRPLAVPSNGIELERRWQLARDMNGKPVLWIQRQRKPLLAPPARRLRFDVMEEANFEVT